MVADRDVEALLQQYRWTLKAILFGVDFSNPSVPEFTRKLKTRFDDVSKELSKRTEGIQNANDS